MQGKKLSGFEDSITCHGDTLFFVTAVQRIPGELSSAFASLHALSADGKLEGAAIYMPCL